MDPTGVVRGVDVSHHQKDIDVGRLPVDLVIARTAQAAGGKYGTTIDHSYGQHKANAKRAGKLFCAYLYLGNAISAAANAALHASCEPDRNVPVMVDWEDGSGNVAFLRAVVAELGKIGYRVVFTYAPRWYWQAQGSPSLAGLPPLVSSRYPDRVPGDFDAQYRKIPTSFWDGYGGNSVVMVQISASGRLQPYPGTDLDLDAYRGTRTQLAALLQPTPTLEELMRMAEPHFLPNSQTLPEGDRDDKGFARAVFAVEVGKLSDGGNSVVVDAMWFVLVSSDFGDAAGSTEYVLWAGDDAQKFIGFADGSPPLEDAIRGNDKRGFALKKGTRIITLKYRNSGEAKAGYVFPQVSQ